MIIILLVGALFGGSRAILCKKDVTLADLQDYTFVLPKAPTDKYWSKNAVWLMNDKGYRNIAVHNLHLGFFLFGKFAGDPSDATISAGYYTADDALIYSVTVDCGAGTWESFAPSEADPNIPETFESGTLETPCVDGDIFDLIFKVEQAHLMKWLYNAQPLNIGHQITTFRKGIHQIKERNRTAYIPSPDERPKGGARHAHKLQLRTTGSAVMDRFAFGRCIAWPESITNNCSAVNEWIFPRSKGAEDNGGAGVFGFTRTLWEVLCYGDEETYYMPLQPKIHNDEYSDPQAAYCCCVNMKTGKLFTGDRNQDCQSTQHCMQTCRDAWDSTIGQ